MWNIIGIAFFFVIPSALVIQVLWWIYLEYRHDRIPILIYHRLISKHAAQQGNVDDTEIIWTSYDTVFADQMAYLNEAGYTTLDLDDYLRIRSGKMARPTKPIIITFDDGYLSTYTMAYPVLRNYGFKATIFVALEPDEYTRKQVEGIDGFITSEQIRDMAENNISIQSHTLTHCIMASLSKNAALYELTESRRLLTDITGRPVNHLAVPRSSHTRRTRAFIREAGYKTGLGTKKGTTTGLSNLFNMPRIVIERDMSRDDFAQCLTPRGAITLRIVGNIKRIPEVIGGAAWAEWIRNHLYVGRLLPLFQTRNLRNMIIAFTIVYLTASVLFAWYLITS